MSESQVTQILAAIEQGNSKAAEELLPLVYDVLRKLAAERLAHERPGPTLQATALVHEAYLRLIGGTAAKERRGAATPDEQIQLGHDWKSLTDKHEGLARKRLPKKPQRGIGWRFPP